MADMMYPLPPEAKGPAEAQLIELRNYLIRMTQQLNSAVAAPVSPKVEVTNASRSGVIKEMANKPADDINIVRRQTSALRDLILKTSDQVYSYIDEVRTQLSYVYVAQSDFGTYKETADAQFVETAKNITETFNYVSDVEGMVTDIRGQILRGIIEYNGVTYFGIAIGQNLQVSGSSIVDGTEYKVIVAGQNFALYTSEGWWFFLNGAPAGWYDSRDGMLHVENIVVENSIVIGNYLISSVGRWGIRYIGA